MDEKEFWRIIESAQEEAGGDDDKVLALVTEGLACLRPGEIITFDVILDDCMARSYRNDLWAAAYIINGGCSDDGFDYFRAWLISRGQQTFERALQDPATLEEAVVMDPGWDAELEEFLYVAGQAYEQKTNSEMPLRSRPPWELSGPEWSEDTVDALYPELSRKADARFDLREP